MNLRSLLFIFIASLLTACNFSLAEDVTPPPNYVSPTPPPTVGPLYPPNAPDVQHGAAIFAGKCAACHGPAGMGDGADGKQLPIPVAALALPQFYRASSPADWYSMVTRGNIERYMPPFASLSEQERWDVVTYARSLHASSDTIEQGRALFEKNCANCPLDAFRDATAVWNMSDDDLVALLKNGGDNVTAIPDLTADEYYAIVDYLRTLAYSVPTPTPEAATVAPSAPAPEGTENAGSVESGTPVPGEASATSAVTPQSTQGVAPEGPVGRVSGKITGENVGGITINLHGYDHGDTGPEENLTLTTATAEDGSYAFENIAVPDNRIFLVDIDYQSVTYQGQMSIVQNGAVEITIPEIKVYPSINDYSSLTFDDARFFFSITDQTTEVVGVYTVYNRTADAIIIDSSVDVPFLAVPAGASNVGYDMTQDSAAIMATENGFAILPNENPYSFVTYYTLPYNGDSQIVQPFILTADFVVVLVPEGLDITSDQLVAGGSQTFQNTNYLVFHGGQVNGGQSLTFDLSGKPKTSVLGNSSSSRNNLLVGVGALGLVLILAGVWMYMRDRTHSAGEDEEQVEVEEEQDGFETREELLDAIIALDDLHRAGKIADEAYQTRRTELKERLKNLG